MNRIAAIAIRHWKPLLALNVVLLATVAYASTTVVDTWTAKADLILPNRSSDLNADLGSLGQLKGGDGVILSAQLNTLKVLSSIMTSDSALKLALAKDPEKDQYPRVSSAYKSLFKVIPEIQSTVITVSVEGSSPRVAQKRAEALLGAFQQRLNELRKDDAGERTRFVEKELNDARQALQKAQEVLARFKESSNLVDSSSQTQQLVAAINNLNNSRIQALSQAQASEVKVRMLSDRLRLTPEQAIRSLSLGENQDYQAVRKKLSDVEALLIETRSKFLDQHPQTQILLFQRDQLRQQLGQYIAQATVGNVAVNTSVGSHAAELIQQLVLAEGEARAQYQQTYQLSYQLGQMSQELRSYPAKQARFLELQRQFDNANGVYNGFLAKVEESKLNAFGSYPSVQILDDPTVGSKPSGPGTQPVILGAILASVFGTLALALFLESRNPLLKPKDIQTAEILPIGGLPWLKQPVVTLDPRFETLTEFQRLASAISMLQLKNHRLMISSATLGEGKTTVTIALAVALTSLGFKVLAVDGDFQKAELSRRLGFPPQTAVNSTIAPVQVRPRFDLLSIRPEKDKVAEFLVRGDFERCLNSAQASGNYDYVLVDSAPVSLTSETALMVAVVPNVLFVVHPGISNRNPFSGSVEELKQYKAQVVGVVLNGMKTQDERYLYSPNATSVDL